MDAPASTPPDYDLDEPLLDTEELRAYLGVLRRHAPLIGAVALAVTAAATLRTLQLPAEYASTARIKLAKEVLDPQARRYNQWDNLDLNEEFINTEVKVLSSSSLAHAALATDAQLRQQLQADLHERGVEEITEPAVADYFLSGLSITPLRDTYLVDVTFESTDPDRCAPAANAVCAAYLTELRLRRGEQTESAESKLTEEIGVLRERLVASEKALREFLEGIRVPNFEDTERLLFARVQSNNTALAEVQRERNRLEAEHEAVQSILERGRPIESAPAIASSPVIQLLRRQVTEAELALAQLGERYGAEWPDVRAARAKRDQLKLLLRAEIETIRAQLEAQRDARIAEEKGLLRHAEQLERESRDLARQARLYEVYRSEVESNRAQYDKHAEFLKEVGVLGRTAPSRVQIIDRAVEALRVRPNHLRNVAMGAILGLALGVVLALVVERLADRIRSSHDATRALGLPVLGVIPDVKSVVGQDLDRYAITQPHSAFAEAFRRSRLQLAAVGAFPQQGCGVLACSSGVPREGKTVCAINLAVAIAQVDGKTLLIDGDLRSPRLHDVFSMPSSPGLGELLGDPSKVDEAIQASEVPGLSVIVAGAVRTNPAELLARPGNLEAVLAPLRERFDRIVIDTPPVAVVSDGAAIAGVADATVLVVSGKRSSRSASAVAATELTRVGARPRGILFNHQGAGESTGYAYYGYHYTSDE